MKKIISLITLPLVFLNVFVVFYFTIPEIIHDLGRHILLGKLIVHTMSVPKINLLSYAFANYPFVNSHWLSEVIFYIVDGLSGLQGLLVITTIISFLSFGLIYLVAVRRSGVKLENLYLINFAALLYLGIYMERTGIRPEIFSYLLLSIFMYILYKYKKGYTKLIFLLIPLEALWVNLHIYFLIGVILVGIFLLSEVWGQRKNFKNSLKIQKTKNLILVFIAIVLTTLLNPDTYKGALFPFNFSSNYGVQPIENYNIFALLSNPPISFGILMFTIAAILFILLLCIYKKRESLDILLGLSFLIFAVFAARNVGIFVFTTFSIFASALLSLDFLQKNKVLVLCIFFACIFLFISEINTLQTRRAVDLNTTNTFKFALDFFIKNDIHGPIYNNFDIGGYFAYRLYPQEEPFLDERPEAYPADFFKKDYDNMQLSIDYFNLLAEKYKFNAAIISIFSDSLASQQIKNFLESSSWKLVYLNPEIAIFVKNVPGNNLLIEKYGISENNFKIDNIFNNTDSLTNLARLFNALGWQEQEAKMDKLIINLNPNNCPVLQRLINITHDQHRNYDSYLKTYNKYCGELFF
jgi:hypothetical protein